MNKIEGCSLFLFCCLPARKVVCSTKGGVGVEGKRFEGQSDFRLSDYQTDMGPGNGSPFTASHVEQGDFGGSLRLARNEGVEMGI